MNIVQKIKDSFLSKKYKPMAIAKYWRSYISDEDNFKKSLWEMTINTNEGTDVFSKVLSLSRLLLQVPQLQKEIASSLFKKIVDAVLTA